MHMVLQALAALTTQLPSHEATQKPAIKFLCYYRRNTFLKLIREMYFYTAGGIRTYVIGVRIT